MVSKIHEKLDRYLKRIETVDKEKIRLAKAYLAEEVELDEVVNQISAFNEIIKQIRNEEEVTYNLLGLVNELEG